MPRRKIGRNERCPCGSGVKYKRCCLSKLQTMETQGPAKRRRSGLAGFLYALVGK